MTMSTLEIKKAVKEALAEENEAGIQPIIIPPLANAHNIESATTTASIVEDFLLQKEDEGVKKDTSLKRYKELGERFAKAFPQWPNEPEQIWQYLRPFAPTNKLNHYNLLKMLFNYGAERGLPNTMAKMKRPKVKEKPKRTIWPEQVLKIEASLETDLETKAWTLGYGMGWRLSEMQRLLLQDITETDIAIHGKEREEEQGLLPEIREVLLSGTESLKPTDHIFQGQRGPMSNNGIYRMIKEFLTRAGAPGSPHTLRHGYGTYLALQGCSAHEIMRLMRHRTLKEAIRYIHMAQSHLTERQRKYCPLGEVKNSQGKGAFVILEEVIASFALRQR